MQLSPWSDSGALPAAPRAWSTWRGVWSQWWREEKKSLEFLLMKRLFPSAWWRDTSQSRDTLMTSSFLSVLVGLRRDMSTARQTHNTQLCCIKVLATLSVGLQQLQLGPIICLFLIQIFPSSHVREWLMRHFLFYSSLFYLHSMLFYFCLRCYIYLYSMLFYCYGIVLYYILIILYFNYIKF